MYSFNTINTINTINTMKFILFSLLCLFGIGSLSAQNWVPAGDSVVLHFGKQRAFCFYLAKQGDQFVYTKLRHLKPKCRYFHLDGSQNKDIQLQYWQIHKDGNYQLTDYNMGAVPVTDEKGLMLVGGLGWYRFNEQGIATQQVQRPPNCPSGFSFVNAVGDSLWLQYCFMDLNCADYDDGLVFYPVTQYMGYEYNPEYQAKIEALTKKEYSLSTHHNESGKPQIMVFAADPQTLKSCPTDDPENTSYVPDELKILNTIGSTPDFYTEKYYKGQFNSWLRQTHLTLDREQNLAYMTATTDSLIYIYNYQGERVGQFPKVGYDRNAFHFFSLAEDQTYRGEKITRKNVRR